VTGLDLTSAAVDLNELADWWAELEADREHGTRRRWTEQQQDVDASGRRVPLPAQTACPECGAELLRRQHTLPAGAVVLDGQPWCPSGHLPPVTWKASAAPGRLDVLEVLVDLVPAALELEAEVREHLCEPVSERNAHLGVAEPVFQRAADREQVLTGGTARPDDVDARMPEALRWLAVHAHRVTDADLRDHIDREAGRMARAARRKLGTAERTQQLRKPCPVCGHLSLVAFLERCPRNHWERCTDLRCTADHGQVVCTANVRGEQPLCECGLEGCSCHRGGRHRWDPEDFRRLGLVLDAG